MNFSKIHSDPLKWAVFIFSDWIIISANFWSFKDKYFFSTNSFKNKLFIKVNLPVSAKYLITLGSFFNSSKTIAKKGLKLEITSVILEFKYNL